MGKERRDRDGGNDSVRKGELGVEGEDTQWRHVDVLMLDRAATILPYESFMGSSCTGQPLTYFHLTISCHPLLTTSHTTTTKYIHTRYGQVSPHASSREKKQNTYFLQTNETSRTSDLSHHDLGTYMLRVVPR